MRDSRWCANDRDPPRLGPFLCYGKTKEERSRERVLDIERERIRKDYVISFWSGLVWTGVLT